MNQMQICVKVRPDYDGSVVVKTTYSTLLPLTQKLTDRIIFSSYDEACDYIMRRNHRKPLFAKYVIEECKP